MKKKIVLLAIVFLCSAVLLYGAYSFDHPYREISRALNLDINITEKDIVSLYDTHGEFHGDGISCIVIKLNNMDSIKNNASWKPFPLSETYEGKVIEHFVYGKRKIKTLENALIEYFVYRIEEDDAEDDTSGGSYFNDSENQYGGKDLVPQIKNGYYCLIDRQSNNAKKKQPSAILDRMAFNLTIGLYDLDSKLLYYLKLDT